MPKYLKSFTAFSIFCFIVAGCTASTTIRTVQPGVSMKINDKAYPSTPVQDEFVISTFGDYAFVAESKGRSPVYGTLPLRFNGGYLALDILVFTPLCLINLREVYPFYEIDIDNQFIRYSKDNMYWYSQPIYEDESDWARAYYSETRIASISPAPEISPQPNRAYSNTETTTPPVRKPDVSRFDAVASSSPESPRYRSIKGVVLNNGTVIRGKILSMNVFEVKIKISDGTTRSCSFENDVETFIKD